MVDPPIQIERDGFVARRANLSDVPAMLRVIRSAFPAWPVFPVDVTLREHLEWKMSLPTVGPDHHTAITLDGELVGSKLRWLGHVRLRGVEYLADSGADFAADPAHQGRGLGRLIVDFERTADRPSGPLGYDPPSRSAAVRERLQAPGKVDHPLRIWVRPISARSFVRTHLRAGGPPRLLRVLVRAVAGRSGGDRGTHNPAVTTLDRFDQCTDALWLAARDEFDFARVRTAPYLNWRYADPRSGRSTILGASDGGDLLAYAVLRPQRGALNLADILVHPNWPQAGAAVLRSAVQHARNVGARSVVAWLPPSHPYESQLLDVGFVPLRETVRNQFFSPGGVNAPPSIIDHFTDPTLRSHITMGDFDFT